MQAGHSRMSVRHIRSLSLAACLSVFIFPCAQSQSEDQTYARYSPCAPPTPVNRGDEFAIGLAFWPGGTVYEWGPGTNASSTGLPGYNPCLGEVEVQNGTFQNYQNYLNDNGVHFGTYTTQVDTMAALRTTKQEQDQLADLLVTSPEKDPVISVVAFRGNIRSEAHYIRSTSTSLTSGTGIVERLGILVTMNGGLLERLEWYDFNKCNDCGGSGSERCIMSTEDPLSQTYTQESCAINLDDAACQCRGISCNAENCTTTYMVAFRGNTASGQALQSAYQMTSAFQYSISAAFNNFFEDLGNDLSSLEVGPTGTGIQVNAGGTAATTAPATQPPQPPSSTPNPTPVVQTPPETPAPTPAAVSFPDPTTTPETIPTIPETPTTGLTDPATSAPIPTLPTTPEAIVTAPIIPEPIVTPPIIPEPIVTPPITPEPFVAPPIPPEPIVTVNDVQFPTQPVANPTGDYAPIQPYG